MEQQELEPQRELPLFRLNKMVEENNKQKIEKQEVKEEKKPEKNDENKKTSEPKEKEMAIVRGHSLRISPKHSKYIGKMIMRKQVDLAIEMLEQVIQRKRVVKMYNAEVPHRKGKNVMSGKYPLNASKEFIVLLKQLKANALVSGIENPIITLVVSNKASEPYRKGGRRGKRTHVYIQVKDKTKLKQEKK